MSTAGKIEIRYKYSRFQFLKYIIPFKRNFAKLRKSIILNKFKKLEIVQLRSSSLQNIKVIKKTRLNRFRKNSLRFRLRKVLYAISGRESLNVALLKALKRRWYYKLTLVRRRFKSKYKLRKWIYYKKRKVIVTNYKFKHSKIYNYCQPYIKKQGFFYRGSKNIIKSSKIKFQLILRGGRNKFNSITSVPRYSKRTSINKECRFKSINIVQKRCARILHLSLSRIKTNLRASSNFKDVVFMHTITKSKSIFNMPLFNVIEKRRWLTLNKLKFFIRKKLDKRKKREFFYAVHISTPKKRVVTKSLFGLKSDYYRKVSLFYGFDKVSKFIRFAKNSTNASSGSVFSYLLFLESRLETIMLRCNFLPSIYFIKKFVRGGKVFVNNRSINYPTYNIRLGEIVSIDKSYHDYIYKHMISSLIRGYTLLNNPTFMEVDYKLLVLMFTRNPKYQDITRPASFKLYTPSPSIHR